METLGRSSVEDPAELHLLTSWQQDRGRVREAGLLSVAAHAAAIVALILMPRSLMQPPRRVEQITPLISPPTELTQKAPNKGPIAKEVTVEALQPRPRIQIPNSPPSTTRPHARITSPAAPPAPALAGAAADSSWQSRRAAAPRLARGPSDYPAAAKPGAGETEAGIRDSHCSAALRRSGQDRASRHIGGRSYPGTHARRRAGRAGGGRRHPRRGRWWDRQRSEPAALAGPSGQFARTTQRY